MRDVFKVRRPGPRRRTRTCRPGIEGLECRQVLSTYTVTNINTSGPGSLLEAIGKANASGGTDVIAFNLEGTGPFFIPANNLPPIIDSVTIDGFTQPGSNPNGTLDGFDGNIQVVLVCVNAGANQAVLDLQVGNNTIRGIRVTGGSVGIRSTGGADTIVGNVIGSFLGTPGNPGSSGGNGIGVEVAGGNGIRIGGSAAGERNVIAGNGEGVRVVGATNAGIRNNAMRSNGTGIAVNGGLGTVIANNIIGSSGNDAIRLTGASANTQITGNTLGISLFGNIADSNRGDGVAILDQSAGTRVGGTGANDGNRIVFSGGAAIRMSGPGASGALIQGNTIGTDGSGNLNQGNGSGIRSELAAGNHLIGGIGAAAANTIAYSGGAGVLVATGSGTTIRGNSIFNNGGLGIDLAGDGVTPNHTGGPIPGAPNGLLNFPVLTSVVGGPTMTSVMGTYNGAPGTTFTLEFFASPTADPSGFGQGRIFLGTTVVTTGADGNASFAIDLPQSVQPGFLLSATATDPNNNTSEFARTVLVQNPAPTDLKVTLTASPGNLNVGDDVIYTVRVDNLGPSLGTGVTVTQVLPPGSVLVSAQPSQGTTSLSGQTLTIKFGALSSGANATATVRVTIGVAGSNASTVTVAGNGLDTDLTNNQDQKSVDAANQPGRFSFQTTDFQVNEGAGTATITVFRLFGTLGTVSVDYATVGGTAAAGADYLPTQGTLTFGDGVSVRSFTVTILTDALAEGSETVNLALSNPQGGALLAQPNNAALTIFDAPGKVRFATDAFFVSEDGGDAVITIVRTDGKGGPLSVQYATSDGTAIAGRDYNPAQGVVLFPENSDAFRTFRVPILPRVTNDGSRTVVLTLSNPSVPDSLGTITTATLTIIESAGTFRLELASVTVAQDGQPVVLQVFRDGGAGGDASVRYSTADLTARAGFDYTAVSGILTFLNGESFKSITIPISVGRSPRAPVVLTLNLSDPTDGTNLGSIAQTTITLKDIGSRPNDYEGDRKTDLALYRRSIATWLILPSGGAASVVPFGAANTDEPVPADYDGDGKTDLAVYRPSTAQWLIIYSGGGAVAPAFGAANLDLPVSADYDGDGKADMAVYRPSTAQWFILGTSTGPRVLSFGAANVDVPVPADYDGDGKIDVAVFRPNTAQWFILKTLEGPTVFAFGAANLDKPVPADYDGDGKADVAVYRPTTTQWLIAKSRLGAEAIRFGAPVLDLPVPADYDGDGLADLGVFRPSTAEWLIARTSEGAVALTFGATNRVDLPLQLTPADRPRYGPLASGKSQVPGGDDPYKPFQADPTVTMAATTTPKRLRKFGSR